MIAAMPQGGHMGDAAHTRWLMQGVDALAEYAERLEATVRCYAAQTADNTAQKSEEAAQLGAE